MDGLGYLETQLLRGSTKSKFNNTISRIEYNYGSVIPIDKDIKVLDIGPGRGEFIHYLLSKNYKDISCIDINDDVLQHVKHYYPLVKTKHVKSSIEYFHNLNYTFDLVTMFHVLEHIDLDESIKLLQIIKEQLSADGLLIIEVPNLANVFTGSAIYSSDVTHKTQYTSKSLLQVLLMSGFESVEVCNITNPVNSIQRIVQKIGTTTLNLLQHTIYKTYLPSEKFLLSPTIFAVAKK